MKVTKHNRIIVLGLAALILAVVTSGTASANVQYPVCVESQDYGSSASMVGSYQTVSRDVHYYEQLGWKNMWDNRWSCSSKGYVNNYQSQLNYPTGGYTIQPGGYVYKDDLYGSLDGNPGTYNIVMSHSYQDNAPARGTGSLNHMSFNELSW